MPEGPSNPTLNIRVDPTGAVEGNRRAAQSFQEMRRSAHEATRSVDDVARAQDEYRRKREETLRWAEQRERQWQAQQRQREQEGIRASVAAAREQARASALALEQQFQRDMARIKEGVARGFLTPAEAAQAGREAALAYNQGVISAIDRTSAAAGPAVFYGPDGAQTYQQLAGSLKNVSDTSRSATLNVGRLNPMLGSLAARAAGAHPVTGQLANTLGSFAIGSALTVGVLAGLAAVGLAWRAMTREAREAKEAFDKAFESYGRLARERATYGMGDHLDAVDTLQAGLDALQKERQKLERLAVLQAGAGVDADGLTAAGRRLQEIEEEEREIRRSMAEARQQAAEVGGEEIERRRREREAAEREAERAAKEAEEKRRKQRLTGAIGTEGLTFEVAQAKVRELTDQLSRLRIDLRFADTAEDLAKAVRETAEQLERAQRAQIAVTPARMVDSVTGAPDRLPHGRIWTEEALRNAGRVGGKVMADAFALHLGQTIGGNPGRLFGAIGGGIEAGRLFSRNVQVVGGEWGKGGVLDSSDPLAAAMGAVGAIGALATAADALNAIFGKTESAVDRANAAFDRMTAALDLRFAVLDIDDPREQFNQLLEGFLEQFSGNFMGIGDLLGQVTFENFDEMAAELLAWLERIRVLPGVSSIEGPFAELLRQLDALADAAARTSAAFDDVVNIPRSLPLEYLRQVAGMGGAPIPPREGAPHRPDLPGGSYGGGHTETYHITINTAATDGAALWEEVEDQVRRRKGNGETIIFDRHYASRN